MAPDGSDQKSLQQFIKLPGSRKPMWRRKIGEKPLTDVALDQCLWRTWYISSLRAFRLACDEWEGGGSAGKGAETDEGQTDEKNPSWWSASFVTWVCVGCLLAIALPVTILSLLALLVTFHHTLSPHPPLYCHSVAQMPCQWQVVTPAPKQMQEDWISCHQVSGKYDVSFKFTIILDGYDSELSFDSLV